MRGNPRPYTDRVNQVEEAIETFLREEGFSPSVRDISDRIGLSTSSTYRVLSMMAEEGLITWSPGLARSIRITGTSMKAPDDHT